MNTDMHILSMAGLGLAALLGLILLMGLMYAVHCALEKYCYIPYAKKFCRQKDLQPVSWRCEMASQGGAKTEYSIVALHCLDCKGQEHTVRLLVWFLGVKAVLSIEPSMPNASGPPNE